MLCEYLMVPVRREGFFRRRNRGGMAPSFGLIATFLRHSPDSQLFQEENFERLGDFLNDLDLSVLSQEQADGARTHMDLSLTRCKSHSK